MASHLFIVYFAGLSMVTPPVALAAFTAAPIADADPFETSWQATRLSIAGFIIPYLFVFHPEILLIVDGFSIIGLIWAIMIFIGATWGIATALSGWERVMLPFWQRGLRLISAVLLIIPVIPTALTGFGLLLACIAANRFAALKTQSGSIHL